MLCITVSTHPKCANKCDLPVEAREVSTEDGRRFAKLRKFTFFETSAKHRVNVDEPFEYLIRILRDKSIACIHLWQKLEDGEDIIPVKTEKRCNVQ